VRAADGVGVLHDALAGNRRGDGVERDGGADDIGGLDDGGPQRLVAEETMMRVRIAHDDVRAKFREFGQPGEAALVNLVPELDRTLRADRGAR